MYKASCLITFRRTNSARFKNFEFLLGLLKEREMLEIVLVEQDEVPKLVDSTFNEEYRYVFARNPGLFNKSWGLNVAARTASCDILIFMDADILLAEDALEQMLELLTTGADAVNPYATLIDLEQSETESLLHGEATLDIQREEVQLDRQNLAQKPPYCGGVFGITRDLFNRVGGFDERFEGWGAEDNAMSFRVDYFARNSVTLDSHPAYHLWHPKAEDDHADLPQILGNPALLTMYFESSASFYEELAEADLPRNGNIDKYQAGNEPDTTSSESPLISCLCVTRDRVDLLSRAIECFQRQTWPNRELVILCEDDDSGTVRFLEQVEDERIQVHIIPAQTKLSLGALRNLSIEHANGQYICQWDDDDWYHPQRLALQLQNLEANGKEACVLARWLIYDGQMDKAWCSNGRLWEGSLLCSKVLIQGSTRYANTSTGEDTYLIEQLYIEDQITVYDQPDLYVYIYSGRNTWDDLHFQNILDSSVLMNEKDTRRLGQMVGVA
jgi:glycosyltransferase involved in cell wall biosynthesis